MSKMRIWGGLPLEGAIRVQGSKNAALPILCACLLIPGEVVLHGVPDISDVRETAELLRGLGASVARQEDTLVCNCRDVCRVSICGELTKKSRMSVLLFGAILARFGHGSMEYPGGCNIGSRPIDLHEQVFRTLGADIRAEECGLRGEVNGFQGGTVRFSKCSVGATENAILCAVTARGTTRILGAAKEPEVEALCEFLQKAGARILWYAENELLIEGVASLHETEYQVIPDRIVAGTYLAATAITGGCLELLDAPIGHMGSMLEMFFRMGCGCVRNGNNLFFQAPERLVGGHCIKTVPYPGFPTDMQPFAVALLSVAEKGGMLEEGVFEHRFGAMREMNRMGAELEICPPYVRARGSARLHGAEVCSTDLRGGAALAVMALAAEGETVLQGMEYVRRGYEHLPETLRMLGARCREEE